MWLLVHINLAAADLLLFEAYEAAVLPLLARHGARLDRRLRARDATSETHLLSFPDAASLEAYRHDPDRLAAQPLWDASGARSDMAEVHRID